MNNSTKFHSYKVKEVVDKFKGRLLIVDNSYQRRSVWLERDKIRLIETMLNQYLMPPLYFWHSSTDAESGEMIQHIVDGQQRVTAIVDFIENKFKLDSSSLTLSKESHRYKDAYFSQLSSEERSKIWSYELPAIDLRNDVTKEQIPNIFTRLNLTEYSLNNQERRHSGIQGKFAELSIKLADYPFWEENNLFTAGDIKRMKDVEFCSSLLLLSRKGIIDQANQRSLNEAYDDFKEVYLEASQDEEKIIEWMQTIERFLSKKTKSFISKKTQLYSMFCLADYIQSENIELTESNIKNFHAYIDRYNAYKNSDPHVIGDEMVITHKLASSEGIHKQKNRMLRFRALKCAVFNLPFRKEIPLKDEDN